MGVQDELSTDDRLARPSETPPKDEVVVTFPDDPAVPALPDVAGIHEVVDPEASSDDPEDPAVTAMRLRRWGY